MSENENFRPSLKTCEDGIEHDWHMTPIVQFSIDFLCARCGSIVHIGLDAFSDGFADQIEPKAEEILGVPVTAHDGDYWRNGNQEMLDALEASQMHYFEDWINV